MNKFKYIIYICLGILLYLLINILEGFTISAKIWLREIGTENYVDAETLNLPLVPAPEGQDHETTLLETVNHYLDMPPQEGGFQNHYELAPVDCVAQSSSPHMDEPTDVTLDAERLMAQDFRIQNKEIYCQLTNAFLNKFDSIFDSLLDVVDDNGNVITLTLSDKKEISELLSGVIIDVFIKVTGQSKIIFGSITTIRSLLNHNLDACAAIASCFDIDYSTLDPFILIHIIELYLSTSNRNVWNTPLELLQFIEKHLVYFIYFSIIYKDYLSNIFDSKRNLEEDQYDELFRDFMKYIIIKYRKPIINKDNYKQELKKLYVMFWCFDLYPSIRNAILNELYGWGGQITHEEVPDWDIFQIFEHHGRLTLFNSYPELFQFLSGFTSFMKWYSKFCDTSDT